MNSLRPLREEITTYPVLSGNPLITDEGEVMMDMVVHQVRLQFYTNITVHGSYIRLEGLPKIMVVSLSASSHRRPNTLFLLSLEGELIIIDKNYPTGFTIDSSPIVSICVREDTCLVLDMYGSLRKIIMTDNSYRLSETYIDNVKMFHYQYPLPIIAITNDNILIRQNEPPLQLDHDVKWLLYNGNRVRTVGYDHHIRVINGSTIAIIGTVDSNTRYLTSSYSHNIYTIDDSDKLYLYNLSDRLCTHIEGSYIGFHQLDRSMHLVSSNHGVNFELKRNNIAYRNIPFTLFNLDEHLLLSRVRTKSCTSSLLINS